MPIPTLQKKAAVLFAQNYVGSPTNQIAEFGSESASSPSFTSDPTYIQSLSEYLNGWQTAVLSYGGGTDEPALPDHNALDYLFSYLISYIQQEGIPEWDFGTVFTKGAIAKSTDGLGTLYVSQQAGNQNHLLRDTSWWHPYLTANTTPSGALASAWVCFDGTSHTGGYCAILASANVTSVEYWSVGVYRINYTVNLADDNYVWVGSCGSQNASSPAQGDNNILCGAVTGFSPNAVKTDAQLQVCAWQQNPNQLEDCSSVSVIVFVT